MWVESVSYWPLCHSLFAVVVAEFRFDDSIFLDSRIFRLVSLFLELRRDLRTSESSGNPLLWPEYDMKDTYFCWQTINRMQILIFNSSLRKYGSYFSLPTGMVCFCLRFCVLNQLWRHSEWYRCPHPVAITTFSTNCSRDPAPNPLGEKLMSFSLQIRHSTDILYPS